MIKLNPSNKRHSSNTTTDRRAFIRQAASMAIATPFVTTASCALARGAGESANPSLLSRWGSSARKLFSLDEAAIRQLHLVNAHTGDDLNLTYFANGEYIQRSLQAFNHLMRDRRANVSTLMDLNLYDQLYKLRTMLGTDEPVHVLSGYRTAETNAKLRARSTGVAKYSLHIEGRAADIYVPGTSAKRLHRKALDMRAGGVGLYSKSGFVHVDTGHVRNWGS